MPILRPFRALRFDAAAHDLSTVLAPPYDVISPEQRQELIARDPHNAVRIELPADLGSADADDYRAAARTVAEWRSERVLMKDTVPTVTIHEMRWTDADGASASCTGLLARLRLEEYGPDAGVLPHERTMGGPKEDRYQLLRATGLNTSPIMFLAGSDPAETSALMARLTERDADVVATTPDGIDHRIWVCPTVDPGLPGNLDAEPAAQPDADDAATALLALVASQPVTIADGHHRYETALRYREERASKRACESDPAWDYLLALVYPLDQSPPALPTHRVLRGEPRGAQLLDAIGAVFTVEEVANPAELLARMSDVAPFSPGATGSGRIGIMSGDRAAILRVRTEALAALLGEELSTASLGLDVNVLTAVIERDFGADVVALAADGRLTYVKDATDALAQVGDGDADTAFLLDPMPPSAISDVAAKGEVMPQKSTYFHPKAPTGLLFSPLEW